MRASRIFIAASVLAAAVVCAPGLAEASDLALSAKLGGNWSLLTGPADPRGEPTLLSGSAFDGTGFTGGASLHHPLAELHGAGLELEAGLFFSRHSGEGFEEHADSGEQRYVTLSTTMVRAPVMVFLRQGQAASGFRVGLGVTPMFGVRSGATVEHRNSAAEPEKLHTTPTTHVGATVGLGFDWAAGSNWGIPIDFRATWDPFVPASTRERFEGFESDQDPGAYQVAYDWQLLFLTGLRYEL